MNLSFLLIHLFPSIFFFSLPHQHNMFSFSMICVMLPGVKVRYQYCHSSLCICMQRGFWLELFQLMHIQICHNLVLKKYISKNAYLLSFTLLLVVTRKFGMYIRMTFDVMNGFWFVHLHPFLGVKRNIFCVCVQRKEK